MTDKNEKMLQLLEKLEAMAKRQELFSKEIELLKAELNQLQWAEVKQETPLLLPEKQEDRPTIDAPFVKHVERFSTVPPSDEKPKAIPQVNPKPFPDMKALKGKSDLEKFIGENLINKIGIAITIIGVAIGTKYSIEHELISPLTRIIMGYIFGLALLGFGIKLKTKYEKYSAVLVSGAMAILYFITFSAYAFYNVIPQMAAFTLMVIFTIFTVIAALNYNRQIIAHIGLVGAYAIPFLLSNGSGKVHILFSYITILNIGILAIAFKKYWKPLYFVSFGITWLTFASWFFAKYEQTKYFSIALVFITLFFTIFYLTFLSYKLIKREKFVPDDIILVMLNSFVFYGFGYNILYGNEKANQLLGLFTLANAFVHFVVSVIIYKQKLTDKYIQFLISGLVIFFITIAVPVQLDGNWVTLLWAGFAATLFWIGVSQKIVFYEKLAYPLMVLAFLSILHDWSYVYDRYDRLIPSTRITPILNVHFLTSVLFIGAFAFINQIHYKRNLVIETSPYGATRKIFNYAIPAILIFTLFYAFRMEIANYWNQRYTDSEIIMKPSDQSFRNYYWNIDTNLFKNIWILNFALVFVAMLSLVNNVIIRNKTLGFINHGLLLITLLLFLTAGLYNLSELRTNYFDKSLAQYYHRPTINLWLRYISFLCVALALYSGYYVVKRYQAKKAFIIGFEFVLHTTIIWILSSELINWMDLLHSKQSYKLGLSILWGSYALFLIAYGIWKHNQPLRISAFVLLGVTLIKLFFYDIAHLNTLSKTIVFVSLGVLLLIISFLYNKYKSIISNEENNQTAL